MISNSSFNFLHELASRNRERKREGESQIEITAIAQSSENFMSVEARYKVGEYIDKKGKNNPNTFQLDSLIVIDSWLPLYRY